MNTLDNLADTSLNASLITKICHILASLANNHTSFLGGDNSSQSELRLCIFLIGLWQRFAIRSNTTFVTADVEIVHALIELVTVGRIFAVVLRRRHFERIQ